MTTDKQPFKPSDHLIQLQGKDYLQVMWRLVWLRAEHPDAVIVTERLGFDDQFAMFKATVSIPGGGSATGHKLETRANFGDYAEKAETGAVGRALGMLGYGTQFAPEFDEGDQIADSPVARPQVARPAPSPVNRPAPQGGGQAAPGPRATQAQIKAIYALGHELGAKNDAETDRRTIVKMGVRPQDLTVPQASKLIDALKTAVADAQKRASAPVPEAAKGV